MSRRPRIPLSSWRPGQVLRLRDPLDGVREGWFAFAGRGPAKFRVCRLGEDESGNLTGTDEIHEVHIDFADSFVPVATVGRI